jgi:hypothetical protein
MTANRRDELGRVEFTLSLDGQPAKWFDEVSEIDYESYERAYERLGGLPRLQAAEADAE